MGLWSLYINYMTSKKTISSTPSTKNFFLDCMKFSENLSKYRVGTSPIANARSTTEKEENSFGPKQSEGVHFHGVDRSPKAWWNPTVNTESSLAIIDNCVV